MPNFTGQLRSNEIFASMFNMIISQEVFADNLAHNYNLVDEARVDGSLFGDQKLYFSVDVLHTNPWGNDAEASNLLALDRPKAPEAQSIVLDVFRQIRLTVDYYLSKRFWQTSEAFSSFTSIMLGMLRNTKQVYDNTTYNVFIGNAMSSVGEQTKNLTYTLPQGVAKGTEEANRLTAQFIAKSIADIMDDLKDYTRSYNDYEHLRSYKESDIKIVWNASYVNEITYVDLPTIFHNEDVRKHLTERKLPAKYFGQGLVSNNAITANGQNQRAGVETHLVTANDDIFAGTLIPADAGTTIGNATNPYYLVDDSVVCKMFVKLPPYMSAFRVATSFFNPRSLTENHYLTFGHNTLEYLKNYPIITIKLTVNEA